jgi:hypothetical protein
VERVIEKYGLQKKTLSLPSRPGADPSDPDHQDTDYPPPV